MCSKVNCPECRAVEQAMIVRCAWCKRINFLGIWVPIPADLASALESFNRVTDGICLDCVLALHDEISKN